MSHHGTPDVLLTWLHRQHRRQWGSRRWVLQPCVLDMFVSVRGRLEEVRVIVDIGCDRTPHVIWSNSGEHPACNAALAIAQKFVRHHNTAPMTDTVRIGFDFLEPLDHSEVVLLEINVHGQNPRGCPCKGRVAKKKRRRDANHLILTNTRSSTRHADADVSADSQ